MGLSYSIIISYIYYSATVLPRTALKFPIGGKTSETMSEPIKIWVKGIFRQNNGPKPPTNLLEKQTPTPWSTHATLPCLRCLVSVPFFWVISSLLKVPCRCLASPCLGALSSVPRLRKTNPNSIHAALSPVPCRCLAFPCLGALPPLVSVPSSSIILLPTKP